MTVGALSSLGYFLVAIGILVTVHEFGHFIVARASGVRVLRFSVGFGRPLARVRRGHTEYVLAMIPLGGYVRMLDEREGPVASHERHLAFNRQPVGRRIAIVVAGPAFNFLFAVLAYWTALLIGISGVTPVVGEVEPGGLAAQGGFHSGDLILEIGDRPVVTWNTALVALLDRSLAGERVDVLVRDASGAEQHRALDFRSLVVGADRAEVMDHIGFEPFRPVLAPVIGSVTAGSAAGRGGLRPGDRIVAANGEPVASWEAWRDLVRSRPGERIVVEVKREDAQLVLDLVPDVVREGGRSVGQIGAAAHVPEGLSDAHRAIERHGPAEGLVAALGRTRDVTLLTFSVLGNMVVGNVGVANLSGPVRIAQFAGSSAGAGLVEFIGFLAVISISLGVLNLLPIPVLDGGHLLFYLIEAVRGRPLSDATQFAAQRLGVIILVGIMAVAFYNDLAQLLQ